MLRMLESAQLESTLSSLVAWAKTRGRVLLSIAVRGALQLLLSFIFSVFLYRALYQVRPARPTLAPSCLPTCAACTTCATCAAAATTATTATTTTTTAATATAETDAPRPQLWEDAARAARPVGCYLPFSAGPKGCPASGFAIHEARRPLVDHLKYFANLRL